MARSKIVKASAAASFPRKSLRRVPPASEAVPTRRTNAPGRCKRCDGRPLLSQCEHTKQGKEYLIAQEAIKAIENAMPMQDIPPSASCNPPAEVLGPIRSETLQPSAEMPTYTSPVPPTESGLSWADIIDPALTPVHQNDAPSSLCPSGSVSLTSTPSGLFQSGSTALLTSTGVSDMLSDPAASRAPSSTPTSKRVRASATNPIFKHIKGVLRGNMEHKVYRKHVKPTPIASSTQASRAFLEKMNSLVELSEDISIKTGAWLFVGAQHPGATGGPINYSSPRLRRDGGQRTEEFATSFLRLISKAAEAKRLDTLELQKNLDEQQERSDQLQNALDAARAADASKAQELAMFRERFGSLGDDDN